MTPGLRFGLDFPLPESVGVGRGTALFVGGWCFHPQARITRLVLMLDGAERPLLAHGMPRRDVFEALHPSLDSLGTEGLARDPDSADDPELRSFRSGFWGVVEVPAEGAERRELALRASLDDGSEATAELGAIDTGSALPERLEAGPPRSGEDPFVAICMAAHEPPLQLLERQLDSIRSQTHANWVCVISDDCSSPGRFEQLRDAIAGDDRFVVSRSPRRQGFYANFERALALAPAGADFVAMADQDDYWHPDKLERLLAGIGRAQLVYSDARIVDSHGKLISDTYWSRRRNEHRDIASLLFANSVTGAASLFRRELLDYALPFPPAQFAHFHDHWVALTALALGDIEFVERPLYDYTQHGGAVLGHAEANRMPSLRQRLAGARRDPRERIRLWRRTYYVDNCRLIHFATVLLVRCGQRMTPEKRAALERFLEADRSLPALAGLAGRAARELASPRPATLGAELGLSLAFAWRRMLSASARGLERPRRRLRLDAVPPPTLVERPGRRGPRPSAVREIAEKVAPLELALADDAPERVNLLIPGFDLAHFFGGYIAKLNLARRLAERGARVRVLTVDPAGPLPQSWRREVESYRGLAGLFDRVEVEFGREAGPIEVSRSDSFVATTWWTAHITDHARQLIGSERFLYLIQEYEPFTFSMGTLAALAEESYRRPHFALFSTELLRGWFRGRGFGVYAAGERAGDDASASFENAITPVPPPAAADLARRETRRLLFYARPEPHAARNMYELGMLALARAVEAGALAGWELRGVGSKTRQRFEVAAGVEIALLPRRDQAAYAELLRGHDVGLALMHTPHPSLVPIEMAAAGLVTVTNTYENKTAEALSAISENLVSAEPTVEGITRALLEAAAAAADAERRLRGSQVRWSSDWDRSFDDELMARVEGFLEAARR